MEACAWDTLLRLRKSYSRALEPVCRRWCLTRGELDVLLFLANNPSFDRATDIVERRGIAKSHVSLAVKNLEARGYLACTTQPPDRREVHLRLTSAAADAVAAGQRQQEAYLSALLAGVSEKEQQGWQRILEKIGANLETMEEL